MNRTVRTLTEGNLERCLEKEPLLLMAERGAIEAQLDHLKEQLLRPVLTSVHSAAVRDLRRAATEAAAVAWFSACPILVLPLLLEEKLRSALQWWERQGRMRPRPMPVHTTEAAG